MYENGGITFGAEEVIQFSFRLDNSLERTESFQMGFAYIGDNAIIRFGYPAKKFDFSLMAGSHFYDGKVMFRFQPEQGSRYTDMIIEIA